MGRAKSPIQGDQLDLIDPTGVTNDKGKKFRGQNQPQTPENRTLKVDDLIRAANHLDDADLQQLQAGIAALLNSRNLGDNDQAQTQQKRTLKPDGKLQRGSIEVKTINGCGPYRYLRWWSGGKHRSTYLGKVKEEE